MTPDDEAVRDARDALEALDPGALGQLSLHCPDCGHAWSAPHRCRRRAVDGAAARRRAALFDVDALARAYGWTEPEVLAPHADPARGLSPAGGCIMSAFIDSAGRLALGHGTPGAAARHAAAALCAAPSGQAPEWPSVPTRPRAAADAGFACPARGSRCSPAGARPVVPTTHRRFVCRKSTITTSSRRAGMRRPVAAHNPTGAASRTQRDAGSRRRQAMPPAHRRSLAVEARPPQVARSTVPPRCRRL